MHDLDRLKSLIGLYQKESRDLQKFISSSVNEWDYMMAHHYAQRLGQVNRELQILQTILDPKHGEKQILIRQIANYKKIRSLPKQKELLELYDQWINGAEKKLDKLNSLTSSTAPFSNVLDDILEKLIKGEVRNVKLILNIEQDLEIIITTGRKLILQIPKVKTLLSKSAIWDYQIDLLHKMGFQWNAKKTSLYIRFELSSSTKPVMELLSKIVFKVFMYEEMSGKSYISYR